MKTIKEAQNKTIKEEYTVLVRLQSETELPEEKEKILSWNQELCKSVFAGMEATAESVRTYYKGLESRKEKARFRTRWGRFTAKSYLIGEEHLLILCDVEWSAGIPELPNKKRYAQVWDLREETLLPIKEICIRWGKKLHFYPWKPDGAYPTENGVILYQNERNGHPYREYLCEKKEKSKRNEKRINR